MKRLKTDTLKVGDIILTTTNEKVSKWIRFGTRSDISHAMIYVENSSVIDATNVGVHARNTQRLFFNDECAVYALRLKEEISPQKMKLVIEFIRSKVGTEYSIKEALKTQTGGSKSWTNKQFCSRLVAQGYSQAGINLVADENYCSPSDVKNSNLLSELQNITEPVSDEEIEAWKAHTDVPELMRQATNSLLEGARKKDPSIQTINDISDYLRDHSEDDFYLTNLLEQSGYLEIWQIELEKSYWQYDLDEMNKLPPKEIENYCKRVLEKEGSDVNRYIQNRGQFLVLHRQYGFEFFRKNLELYEALAKLHAQRLMVAKRWLENAGLFEDLEESNISPHSEQWFLRLSAWDPIQSMLTGKIIELERSKDVCSVCGDVPAKDYHVQDDLLAQIGVNTLRLCEDCLGIRRNRGDLFMPIIQN